MFLVPTDDDTHAVLIREGCQCLCPKRRGLKGTADKGIRRQSDPGLEYSPAGGLRPLAGKKGR